MPKTNKQRIRTYEQPTVINSSTGRVGTQLQVLRTPAVRTNAPKAPPNPPEPLAFDVATGAAIPAIIDTDTDSLDMLVDAPEIPATQPRVRREEGGLVVKQKLTKAKRYENSVRILSSFPLCFI